MEKAWFYEILFFQVVIVMIKDKKRCTIKDETSMKISFMHYRNYIMWIRANLPVVFEEFGMACIFLVLFYFPLLLSIGKRSSLTKMWGRLQPPSPPVSPSMRPLCNFYRKFQMCNTNTLQFIIDMLRFVTFT